MQVHLPLPGLWSRQGGAGVQHQGFPVKGLRQVNMLQGNPSASQWMIVRSHTRAAGSAVLLILFVAATHRQSIVKNPFEPG